jgi:hopanoid biosynthesis associated protein HpnK
LNKLVIITGDDFGLALPVNEAIELAHREGVLTTTSLLIGEAAAPDAVSRARRNPGLCVGLHLAVCDGRPTLPPAQIPLLVNARGELHHPVVALLRLLLFAGREAQAQQLEAEMRAQFEAFRAAGLTLDHVNGHNNMQLHPVVLPVLMKLAREYRVNAVRLPYEPLLASWRAARGGFVARFFVWLVMRPWAAYVKSRLRRSGFVVNDYLFGIFDCGKMDGTLLRRIIENLPDGLSEIHCHPATQRSPELDRNMSNYGHEAELSALIAPAVRDALAGRGIRPISGYAGVPTVEPVEEEPRP